MPIVTIEIVDRDSSRAVGSHVTQSLADQLGDIFGSAPGTTWVKISRVHESEYAENRVRPDKSVKPTFIEILKRELPSEDELAIEATKIAKVVADVLERPEQNTHVIYLPEGAGRVAFGGNLVRREPGS